MTNDKDSAVLADEANIEWLAQQLLDWPDKRTDEAKTMAIGTLHRMASATILSQHQELAALRQPTQSDALLEGDAQTILYLLGVKHGQEDERAKIAAEASQPTQSDALRDLVAALYCASGCSCCRDDDAWEKASYELGQLFNIPKYKNGYGYDWHSVHEAALQDQSK